MGNILNSFLNLIIIKILLKVLAVVVALMSTALGAVFMFAPEVLLEKTQLVVGGNFGFSTIRGLIGGPALLAGILVLVGIFRKRYELLHTSAIIFLGWTIGRVMSLFFDGFDSSVFANAVISLLMMTIIIVTYKVLTKEEMAL